MSTSRSKPKREAFPSRGKQSREPRNLMMHAARGCVMSVLCRNATGHTTETIVPAPGFYVVAAPTTSRTEPLSANAPAERWQYRTNSFAAFMDAIFCQDSWLKKLRKCFRGVA